MYWNQNSAETTGANPWGGNAATSSVFTIANDGGVGSSGNDYVAYCFAEVEGYSKFGMIRRQWRQRRSLHSPRIQTGIRNDEEI